MTIDWWTIGLQTINAAVLIWLLARFLFRPVAKVIAERQAVTEADVQAAEADRTAARADREAAAAVLDKVAEERTALLAEARAEAERTRVSLAETARADMDRERQRARADMDRERAELTGQMADEAGILATEIATRLLTRLPPDVLVSGFIDGLARSIAALPDPIRAEIGRDGPVPLRAARALTGPEQDQLTRQLTEVLGHPVGLVITPDPSLIAGLELTTDHAIARNHLAADLDRIKSELTAHD
ncbi:MAG: hypothetical protein CML68_17630 [Rhodobacteraceae bacterium]|nr:hypothetical protein [Paracoccaceae bacterium]